MLEGSYRFVIIFVPGGTEGYVAELGPAPAAARGEPLSKQFHTAMRERFGMGMR